MLFDDNVDSPINLNQKEQFDEKFKKQKENQFNQIDDDNKSFDSFENDFKQFNNDRNGLY